MLFCFGFSAFGFETITHPSRYLTSIVDKTRHGPVIAPFSAQLLQLFQLCWRCLLVRGDAYMTSTLRGWGEGKIGLPVFIFFINETWICAMNIHHAESNINISLTRNLPIDFGVRGWSHPLMIPLYSLSGKSNNRTRGQFECDVTWFCFHFDFIRSHARCGCCSLVCLRGWVDGGRDLFKLEHPRSRGWKNSGRRWAGGEGLENQTVFLNVICVSSLSK